MCDTINPAEKILKEFQDYFGFSDISFDQKLVSSGPSTLVFSLLNPSQIHYKILNELIQKHENELGEEYSIMLKPSLRQLSFQGCESQLLTTLIAETLNTGRHSNQQSFFARYTPSLDGAEKTIISSTNHIVFGRRGAGKTTLLLYAYNTRHRTNKKSVWMNMQQYAARNDESVIGNVLADIVCAITPPLDTTDIAFVLSKLRNDSVTINEIKQTIPLLRRTISSIHNMSNDIFVFLDDYHLLSKEIQPLLLGVIYSLTRDNQLFVKISAVETFTKNYDPIGKIGMEIPHDLQKIILDRNLTTPVDARAHIEAILDSLTAFCALPKALKLCTGISVIDRLTLASAGVPRDALNLFASSIKQAIQKKRRTISVENLNAAISTAFSTKQHDFESDTSKEASDLNELLGKIKKSCINEQKSNAFLVDDNHSNDFILNIRKLIDLRMLHVIGEGITIRSSGHKHLALMLDYGFYVGTRAARSVKQFNSQLDVPRKRDLRQLPVFRES